MMKTWQWGLIISAALIMIAIVFMIIWTSPSNDDEAVAVAFEPKYVENSFSCRDPVNVPGSIFRGTLQKCEEACDNIPACVGFDRRSDVEPKNDAFCYLQMSQCNANTSDKKLNSDQDGEKWKRHIKPSSAL